MAKDRHNKEIEVGQRVMIKMKSGFERYGYVLEVGESNAKVKADCGIEYSIPHENITVLD